LRRPSTALGPSRLRPCTDQAQGPFG
jgi:hypothetical protein